MQRGSRTARSARRLSLLTLHVARILVLQQIGVAVVLALARAHVAGAAVEYGGSSRGVEAAAEGVDEWSAMVRVCGQRLYEISDVLRDACLRADCSGCG